MRDYVNTRKKRRFYNKETAIFLVLYFLGICAMGWLWSYGVTL